MNANYVKQEIKNILTYQMERLLREVDRFEDVEVIRPGKTNISKEAEDYYKDCLRGGNSEKSANEFAGYFIVDEAHKAIDAMSKRREDVTLTVTDAAVVLSLEHSSDLRVEIRLHD